MQHISLKKEHGVGVFFVLFTAGLLYRLIVKLLEGYPKEGWNITEFLINYEGGFVRRGILGELLLTLYQYFQIDVYWTIILVCLIAYVLFVAFFVNGFLKKGMPLFVLPFIFFLGGPIIHDFFIRKDILLALLFILMLRFSLKKQPFIYPVLVNLLLIFSMLAHETVAFYAFPVLGLIYLHRYKYLFNDHGANDNRSLWRDIKSGLITCLILLPAIAVFFSVIYFHGDDRIALSIWNSWESVPFPVHESRFDIPPAAIDALSWTLETGKSLTIYYLLKVRNIGVMGGIAWIVILAAVYVVMTNIHKMNFTLLGRKPTMMFNVSLLSSLLFMQFIALLPLFVIATDYGRWIFLWVISSCIIFLVVPEKELSAIIPKWITSASALISRFLNVLVTSSRGVTTLICIMIGFPYYKWNFLESAATNAFVTVLEFISTIAMGIVDK
ncbi:MAG: hypothetical protein LBD45_00760 [Bacteroidales bacterium]|jgi:hypothetical protein|nr:hypothetical protein [Bacteroidales bacterium]